MFFRRNQKRHQRKLDDIYYIPTRIIPSTKQFEASRKGWSNRKLLAITGGIILLAILVTSAVSILIMSITLQDTSGEVVGVGISADITSIDWGSLYPEGEGTPYSKTVFFNVTNDKNYECELTVTLGDENPSDIWTWATFTSNINGTLIDEYDTAQVWVDLSVGATAPQGDSFNFDIIITAESTL